MKTAILFASILAIGSLAHAVKPKDDPACADIIKSCEAAGYIPGMHKKNGKGAWIDCVRTISKGGKVEGVNATQAQAQACIAAAKVDRDANKAAKAAKTKP